MRVKVCSRCPYTPRDLAGYYDPDGILHLCAKCDGKQGASTNHHPRKIHRSQQCETFPNIPGTAQPSVAQFATEDLASYGTTPGEPPSAQRSALTASRHARRETANGYIDFTPPDDCNEALAALFQRSGFWSKEPEQ